MKIKRILWLDDFRNPAIANWSNWLNMQFPNEDITNIIWVKTYDEAELWIIKNGLPDAIAFDHDLGEEKTGYDLAKYIVEYCLDYNKRLPDWVIQSDNTVGKENINKLFMNFIKRVK